MDATTATKPDFVLAKTLLAEGVLSPKEITERTGVRSATLRVWRSRVALKLQPATGEKAPKISRKGFETLQEAGEKTRLTLASAVLKQAEILDTWKKPETVNALARHANVASTITATASQVFGWKDSATGNLSLTILAQLPEPPTETALAQTSQVIEVETVG